MESQHQDLFADPVAAQRNFANAFDPEDPMRAMNSYQRVLYEHTRHQLLQAKATSSCDVLNRRTSASKTPSLSTSSSVDSDASQQS